MKPLEAPAATGRNNLGPAAIGSRRGEPQAAGRAADRGCEDAPSPTAGRETLFDIRGLTFRYGADFHLTIDALTVAEGDRLGIVGPNGSGKTTLLRILALLERPARCERFRCRGRDLRARPVRPRDLTFLRQHPYLFRGSVAHNLSYPLRLRGVPRPKAAELVVAMLIKLDMQARQHASTRTLSGGEQKRLALGRVLLADPRILLLDEPTAHLDRHSQGIIERTLARHPATLIFTTHDTRLAHRLATHLLHLREGRVSESLPENILTGLAIGDRLVTNAGLTIFLGETPAEGPLKISLDPRHLVLSTQRFASSMRNQLRGRVTSIQDHGSVVWLEIDCGQALTAIITRESYESLRINLRSELFVSFKAQAVEVL